MPVVAQSLMSAEKRKVSFKVPPNAITDNVLSQEARRAKALDDQKRRRAQKVDSARQLELFADLSLGPSDDDESEVHTTPTGVSSFASLLKSGPQPPQLELKLLEEHDKAEEPIEGGAPKLPKKRSKSRRKARTNKPSKWANKCMYAELLEMSEDVHTSNGVDSPRKDGLPDDLESGWIAVAPVPVGKRCLAITHQSSGMGGIVPNTTLRSRVLGKSLIVRFPSWLPPLTILDCILDENWRTNGIIHVLDVIQWKGQDVGDCETRFRMWWRDTRLAELPRSPPPPADHSGTQYSRHTSDPAQASNTLSGYQFPYPTSFIPIPYYMNTTLPSLAFHIIPSARSPRSITVDVPVAHLPTFSATDAVMDVDSSLTPALSTQHSQPTPALVASDGLLLYVSQASYEPGTSPLSSWVPIKACVEVVHDAPPDKAGPTTAAQQVGAAEGPLDVFERLVLRRIALLKSNGVIH